MIGATIDQYSILKSLGPSLVGEAYLATHAVSGEQVVLEALAPEVLAQPGFRKAFLDEIPAQLQLDHPNIQLLINVLDANGRLFLVKEYQAGQTLEQWLKKNEKGLPLEQAFSVLKDLIRALTMAQSLACPHRQMNPRKIWLTDDGEVKLMGFGQVLSSSAEMRMSPADQLYAARYHSPERTKNPATNDIRATIYALGALFFEMLTGQPPFKAADLSEMQRLHAQAPLPNPCQLRAGLPTEFTAFFQKALAKSPTQRFQTFGEVVKEMDLLPNKLTKPQLPPKPLDFSFEDSSQLGPVDSWDFNAGIDSTVSDQGFMDSASASASEHDLGGEMELGTSGGFDFDSYDKKFSSAPEKSIFDDWNMTDKGPSSEKLDLDNLNFKKTAPKAQPTKASPAAPNDPFGFGSEGADDYNFDGFANSAMPTPKQESFADLNFDDQKKPSSSSKSTPKPDFGDFNFGSANPTAERSNFDDLGLDQAPSQVPDFGFEMPASELTGFNPQNDVPDFGFDSQPSAEPDSGFGAESFDFGAPASDPAPLRKTSVPPAANLPPKTAPAANDFGFGFDSPSSSSAFANDSFDFGASEPQEEDPFGFGDSAPDPDPFAFDTPAAQPAQKPSFDFGASDSNLDFGLGNPPAEKPASNSFDFFSSQPSPTPPVAEKPSGFDFGFEESVSDLPDFSAPAAHSTPAAPANIDPFGFGSTSDDLPDFASSPSSFGAPPSPTAASNMDAFHFDDEPAPSDKDPFAFGSSDDFLGEPEPFKDPEAVSSPTDYLAAAPASKTPSYDFDSNEADFQPLGPKSVSEPSMSTADGAFSFDLDDDAPPTTPPSPKEGLDRTLATLEEQTITPVSKKKKPDSHKQKTVRRFDKKMLGLTVGLALLVLVSGGLWWRSSKASEENKKHIQEVQGLMDLNLLEDATTRIDHFIPTASGDFKRNLQDMRAAISKKREETAEQIKKLLERAKDYELQNVILKDGRNDAYGTYVTILELDPKNEEAKVASDRIRIETLSKVDQFLGSGKELDALKVLSYLVKANQKDIELRDRHRQLADKLKKERSDTLTRTLESLVSKNAYENIPETFKELEQIDPNSDYLAKRRPELVRLFTEQAQNAQAKRKIENAVALYEGILEFDKENKAAKKALDDLKEERLRYRVERLSDDLQDAMSAQNFKEQYRIGSELLKMDPGNQIGNSALESVRKETSRLASTAEDLRKNGQFKEAGQIFRAMYEIDNDPSSYDRWKKYETWAPPPGMAYVPPGDLTMGSRDYSASMPVHRVSVGGFFIDKFEVTNGQFKDFVNANPEWSPARINPSYHDGHYLEHWENEKPLPAELDRPVVFVSWYAAKAYAKWKQKFLPTEAQWERAASGNTFNQKYWWGNYSDAKMAVYEFFPEKRPANVGSFPANKFGIYEILGNVAEWTLDTWDPKFYERSPLKDPLNDASDSEKVYRGGSFKSPGKDLIMQLRFHKDATTCNPTLGFRCALASEVE